MSNTSQRLRSVAPVRPELCRRALRRQLLRTGMTGATTAEYAAVMLGLIAVWRVSELVLQLVREHHREFTWALTLPF